MMKILLAIDESAHSGVAVDWVRARTWPPETEVVVLSVARTPVTLSTEMYATGISYDEGILVAEREFRARLVRDAANRLEAPGVKVAARVATGDPRIEIVDLARKEGVDLIVVGSHGRSRLARLLLGSVASHVVAHAPCSVAVIKPRPEAM